MEVNVDIARDWHLSRYRVSSSLLGPGVSACRHHVLIGRVARFRRLALLERVHGVHTEQTRELIGLAFQDVSRELIFEVSNLSHVAASKYHD